MISRMLSAAVTAVSAFFRVFGGRACRFHPSCSAYAHRALDEYSPARALRLIAGRLLRCHPFSSGGFDPVPPGR